jgi:fructokinase
LSALDTLYSRGPAAVRAHVFGGEFDTPIVRNLHGDSSGVRGAAMLWEDA